MFEQIFEKAFVLFIIASFIFFLAKFISFLFRISLKRAVMYVVVFFGIVMSCLFLAAAISLASEYKNRLENPNYKGVGLIKVGSVPKFELTNQNGKIITNETYKGKVYVLEFFFSTCPSICPIMNKNMVGIQNEFFGNPNFGIASITINPEYDTVGVLKEHADLIGVKSSNWHMLTGDKDYIFNLANKGFNLYTGENKKASGGFEHSGLFALIDKEGNIRCRNDKFGNPILYYDGLEKEGVKAITEDIKKLLNE